MSILANVARVGNFTSSEIYRLTSVGSRPMTKEELAEHKRKFPKSQKKNIADGFGATALSYIQEKNYERRLGRPLTSESDARALAWGKLLEPIAYGELSWEYDLCSQVTLRHEIIPFWAGSPDVVKPDTVGDIKCPITLKSFCCLVETGSIEQIRANHPDGEKYYWQLVSNAILTNTSYAELIVYMPYRSALQGIKLAAMDEPSCRWIEYSEDLPYIIDGGYYKDLNTIRFEVPQTDKDFLTNCVIEAGKLLI